MPLSFRHVLTFLLLSACSPSGGTLPAPVPASELADLPWEAAYDPDERDRTFAGVTVEVLDPVKAPQVTRPLPGVRVELLMPRPDGHGPLVPVAETISDGEGRFVVGKAPPTGFVLRASKAGFATMTAGRGAAQRGIAGMDAGPTPPLRLLRAVHATGSVHDRAGRPVANALVQATALTFFAETRTAADGSFAFEIPEAGVTARVFDPAWDVASASVVPVVGDPVEPMRIVTAPVTPLDGFVVTEEDDRFIEGAVAVSLEDFAARASAGADGRFVLPRPREGRLGALADGRQWCAYFAPRAGELEVRLAPARGAEGRVVDAAGNPVPDARIVGVTTGRLQFLVESVPGPRTDAQGRFRFTWAPTPPPASKRPTLVLAWHRKLGVSQVVRLPVEGPITLQLGGMRTIEGVLVDAAGHAVPDVHATVVWGLPGVDADERGVMPLWSNRTDATDAQGRFRFRYVPAGVPVRVSIERFGLALTHDIAADEPLTAVRAVNFQLPAGQPVRGRVVTAAGGPPGAVGTVTLRLLDAPGIELTRSVPSAEDGTFVAEDLPPGRYHVRGHVAGFDLDGGGEARPGGADVRLELGRTAKISVRLLFESDADEEAAMRLPLLAWADLADSPPKRFDLRNQPGGDTTFEIGRLDPNKWLLRVESPGDVWRGRQEITVADGADQVVDIKMTRTLRLRGTLLFADGSPAKGEAMVLFPERPLEAPYVNVRTGEGGSIDVAGLLPGAWEVRVTPQFRAPLRQRIVFPSERPIELRLPPSGDALVTVLDAEGEPLPGAFVDLQDGDGKEAYAWSERGTNLVPRFKTDDEGRALIQGILVGRARVSVSSPGASGRRPPVAFDVRAGERAEVTVK